MNKYLNTCIKFHSHAAPPQLNPSVNLKSVPEQFSLARSSKGQTRGYICHKSGHGIPTILWTVIIFQLLWGPSWLESMVWRKRGFNLLSCHFL